MKVGILRKPKDRLQIYIITKKYSRLKIYEREKKLFDRKIYTETHDYLGSEITEQEIKISEFDLRNITTEIKLLHEVLKYLKILTAEQFEKKFKKDRWKKRLKKRS